MEKLSRYIIKLKTTARELSAEHGLCDYLCEIETNTCASVCVCVYTYTNIHSAPLPKQLLESDYLWILFFTFNLVSF